MKVRLIKYFCRDNYYCEILLLQLISQLCFNKYLYTIYYPSVSSTDQHIKNLFRYESVFTGITQFRAQNC